MTKLEELDKNISNFEQIVKEMNHFSEITKFLSNTKESLESGIKEIHEMKNNFIQDLKILKKGNTDFSESTQKLITDNEKSLERFLTSKLSTFKSEVDESLGSGIQKIDKMNEGQITFINTTQKLINDHQNALEKFLTSKLSTFKSEINAAIRDGGNEIGIKLENSFNKKNFTLIILQIIIMLLNVATLVYLILKDMK